MHFKALVLVASAIVLGACSGGGEGNTDTGTTTTGGDTGAAAAQQTPTTQPAGQAAPITGTTHTVNMVVTANGEYRFEPANITIKPGDGVKWVMVSGGPHNVAFQNVTDPAAKSALLANMPNQASELSSPMFMNPGEEYTVSFANVPAGKYDYVCTPHLALGMTGTVTVQQ